MAGCIKEAAQDRKLPEGIFIHIHGSGFEVGKALVMHPLTRAVGFTGSVEGGRALFDLAGQRPMPIPVFAEMGSVNPVFLLSNKLKVEAPETASKLALSITQSAGQFCTNPGLLIGIISPEWEAFKKSLSIEIARVEPVKMLHSGIARSFHQKRTEVLQSAGVQVLSTSIREGEQNESFPTVAICSANRFLANPKLHQEVFGPFSLLVECEDSHQLLQVSESLEGQLTCSIMAGKQDLEEHRSLLTVLREKAGRIILNGVPTGVEVALSMHHGGPYPATTDSRFTAVGADGIRRFARPVCYQGWSNEWLPPELKNENPLQIWRTVNNELTREGW
jgi:NADP-dependent aldehyde dehydrogenase